MASQSTTGKKCAWINCEEVATVRRQLLIYCFEHARKVDDRRAHAIAILRMKQQTQAWGGVTKTALCTEDDPCPKCEDLD